MNYDKILLNDLIEIYEKRDANSSNFKQSIKITLTKDKYGKYFDDVIGFDEAIHRLNKKGYISIKYFPHDNIIKYFSLNIDAVEEIKKELGIEDSVDSKREKLLNELSLYDDEIITNLKNDINVRIATGKSIKSYLTDEMIDAIKAVHYIENLNHDVYERNASNYIFNDSKRLAKIKNMIVKIYGNENIFEEKGILQVTPFVYLKGQGVIVINGQIIDLKKIGKAIALPIDDLDIIRFDNIKKVVTIENYTTFFDYNDNESLIIYLGGFSTRSQKKLLLKIKKQCDDFTHFGDLDYGGFTILNNLIEELEINIKTINMNLETLVKNKRFCQKITDFSYLEKLSSLLKKENLKSYHEVINYMIEEKIRLEQESFYNV